jgi:hypothetical protein
MRRHRSPAAKPLSCVVAALAASVAALYAGGCGGAGKPVLSGAEPPADVGALADQVASSSCSASASSTSSRVVRHCVFVLTDGRRFRCLGSAFARSTPSANALVHANACAALKRLVITAASRAVFAAIGTARACLSAKGLRVSGGPVVPPDPHSPRSPDGELIVGNVAGGAFIAFYKDPRKAQRLEPDIVRNAKRFGGEVERRGAVTVLWIRRPASDLRNTVKACAFR